jgi:chemotaxis protein MotB
MRRQSSSSAPHNNDRWLISYADFITLMFAFFVVLFASSQTDKAKLRAFQESYTLAVQKGAAFGLKPQVSKVLGGTVDEKGLGNAMLKGPGGAAKEIKDVPSELLPPLNALSTSLKQEIEDGRLEVNLEARGLVVSYKQTALFRSGDDRIQSEAVPVFEKIASVLQTVPNQVRIEGHTDSVPIHNSRFRSNWELSAARSIAVMDLLINQFHIERERLAIVGYAENLALGDNESEAGRGRNRRVDVVIQNVSANTPKVQLP